MCFNEYNIEGLKYPHLDSNFNEAYTDRRNHGYILSSKLPNSYDKFMAYIML